jgi:hypothetical protein
MPDGLNAAQVAAVHKYNAMMQQTIVAEMRVRQWCIEKAIETDAPDRVDMARKFFAFVTATDVPPPEQTP